MFVNKRYPHGLFLVLVLVLGIARAETPPLTLGIHPYLPASELTTRFQPLADYLGKSINRPIEIRVGSTYDEHIRTVGNNEVDIAYMGPTLYVRLVEEFGAYPLLARQAVDGKPELYGAIVVRQDSPFKTLADIKGRRFAFGDPNSTMSHIVPEGMLMQAGIPLNALSEYKFLGAHKNVAIGVLAGDFDAGAVKMEVMDEYAQRGLRMLAKTPAVSEHLFVTRKNMPAQQIKALQQALLNLKDQPDGSRIMISIHKNMTAFVPVADQDYADLRRIMRSISAGSK